MDEHYWKRLNLLTVLEPRPTPISLPLRLFLTLKRGVNLWASTLLPFHKSLSTMAPFFASSQRSRRLIGASAGWLWLALVAFCLPDAQFVRAQPLGDKSLQNYTFADLAPCTLTSLELTQLGADEYVEPCILAHVQPMVPPKSNRSALVTSVQVTPVGCASHRDGAVTAAHVLNADNDNQGVAIGFQQDYHVQFQHVSVIAGNPAQLGTEEYNRRHSQLLTSLVGASSIMLISSQPALAFDGSGSSAYSGRSPATKAALKKQYQERIVADVRDFNTLGKAISKGETEGSAWVNFFIQFQRREPDAVGRTYAALVDLRGIR